MDGRTWSVGELARASGVSVRVLRHWEEIGIVAPARTAGGYRRYGSAEVTRLYRALALRRTGLGLGDIAAALDEDPADPPAILREHLEAMPEDRQHLFPSASEDKPRMKKLFYATWREIRKEARLPARLLPQGCRASHNNWCEKLMPLVSESTRLEHMGHSVRGGEGRSAGIVVNLRNYTGHIPEGHAILRREIERVFLRC